MSVSKAHEQLWNNIAKNASTLKKYYFEFITHEEMDQKDQEKVFFLTKGLVTFSNCLKEKD